MAKRTTKVRVEAPMSDEMPTSKYPLNPSNPDTFLDGVPTLAGISGLYHNFRYIATRAPAGMVWRFLVEVTVDAG